MNLYVSTLTHTYTQIFRICQQHTLRCTHTHSHTNTYTHRYFVFDNNSKVTPGKLRDKQTPIVSRQNAVLSVLELLQMVEWFVVSADKWQLFVPINWSSHYDSVVTLVWMYFIILSGWMVQVAPCLLSFLFPTCPTFTLLSLLQLNTERSHTLTHIHTTCVFIHTTYAHLHTHSLLTHIYT